MLQAKDILGLSKGQYDTIKDLIIKRYESRKASTDVAEHRIGQHHGGVTGAAMHDEDALVGAGGGYGFFTVECFVGKKQ